jgi:hypothetical protein
MHQLDSHTHLPYNISSTYLYASTATRNQPVHVSVGEAGKVNLASCPKNQWDPLILCVLSLIALTPSFSADSRSGWRWCSGGRTPTTAAAGATTSAASPPPNGNAPTELHNHGYRVFPVMHSSCPHVPLIHICR